MKDVSSNLTGRTAGRPPLETQQLRKAPIISTKYNITSLEVSIIKENNPSVSNKLTSVRITDVLVYSMYYCDIPVLAASRSQEKVYNSMTLHGHSACH